MVEFTEPVLLAIETQRHSGSVMARHNRYLELLAPRPGERILDVGCGSGSFCRTLTPLVTPDGYVTGIDVSPDAVNLALRLSAADDPGGLSFICADGQDLPFADASFDAAACISVLEFCQDPALVLAEVQRVLRP